jgi:glycosyltransferase involved in cell wall biosynthesis
MKISVIISVFNGVNTLEKCLTSCFEQSHPLEIIVIDGASSDGSVEIIKKFSHKINYWISEPDSGIYSAWNKALEKATGEWISFLGCDDWWCSPDSLKEMSEHALFPEFNFVSGKMYVVDNNKGQVIQSCGEKLNCKTLYRGIRIAHVGSLHHRSLFECYGFFDENYKIAGDFDFFVRASQSIRPEFIDKNLVYVRNGGLSRNNIFLIVKEAWKALIRNKNYGLVPAIVLVCISYLALLKNTLLRD